MGNQACCVSSLRKDGKSEIVLNSPTARNAFSLAQSNQAQKSSTIQGPPIEPYSSASVLITNSDLPVSSSKVPLEKAKALAEKKKKELKCRKPPPLADFESPNDHNNTNTLNNTTNNTGSQERKPTEGSTNQMQKSILTLGETARDKFLKKGLPDYWDNMDEDKILSVRLSDKRNLSKGSNSTRRIFSQEEIYQSIQKSNDLEVPKPSMEGMTQRIMPRKVGEEEEEDIEQDEENIELEEEEYIDEKQPKIDEEDFYYHEDNSDVIIPEDPQELYEQTGEFAQGEVITGRSQAQDGQWQQPKEENDDKISQDFGQSFRGTPNLSVLSRNSMVQNQSPLDRRLHEAPHSQRKEFLEKPNLSAVVIKSEREPFQLKEGININKEAGPQAANNANLYEKIITSSRNSARRSSGTPRKYAQAFANEDLNGSRLDYNNLLKDSMSSMRKSGINNTAKVMPSPQQTLHVADLLLSAKRSPSVSNTDAISMIYGGSARATDTLRSDCMTNQSKASPNKGKRLLTADISPQIYQDSSASPEKKPIAGKNLDYLSELGPESWERQSKKAKLYENNSGLKTQFGQSETKNEVVSMMETKSSSKPWELGKPYEARLSTEGGSISKERPSLGYGKLVVSERGESNKSGSSWRDREGKLPLRNSKVGGDNGEEKKITEDSARSRSNRGKFERGGNEDEVKKLVEKTLNRIYERKSVERPQVTPLPLPKGKEDLNSDSYATGGSLSRMGSRGSLRMRDSQRWESVQRDVQKLVDNATKPKSGLLETYLKCTKENNESAPRIGVRRNSRDLKGMLEKSTIYSHPSWGVNGEEKNNTNKENQQSQTEQGETTPGFPNNGETNLNRKWESYTIQERREMLLNKNFLAVPTSNLHKNI